jgi:hypothetical protein
MSSITGNGSPSSKPHNTDNLGKVSPENSGGTTKKMRMSSPRSDDEASEKIASVSKEKLQDGSLPKEGKDRVDLEAKVFSPITDVDAGDSNEAKSNSEGSEVGSGKEKRLSKFFSDVKSSVSHHKGVMESKLMGAGLVSADKVLHLEPNELQKLPAPELAMWIRANPTKVKDVDLQSIPVSTMKKILPDVMKLFVEGRLGRLSMEQLKNLTFEQLNALDSKAFSNISIHPGQLQELPLQFIEFVRFKVGDHLNTELDKFKEPGDGKVRNEGNKGLWMPQFVKAHEADVKTYASAVAIESIKKVPGYHEREKRFPESPSEIYNSSIEKNTENPDLYKQARKDLERSTDITIIAPNGIPYDRKGLEKKFELPEATTGAQFGNLMFSEEVENLFFTRSSEEKASTHHHRDNLYNIINQTAFGSLRIWNQAIRKDNLCCELDIHCSQDDPPTPIKTIIDMREGKTKATITKGIDVYFMDDDKKAKLCTTNMEVVWEVPSKDLSESPLGSTSAKKRSLLGKEVDLDSRFSQHHMKVTIE